MKIQITAELLDGIVLAILENKDYYGYALTQQIKQSIDVSESTMYPVLRRLQKHGFLKTYDQPYQGRNRRYYQITSKGKDELVKDRQLWKDYERNVDKILNNRAKED